MVIVRSDASLVSRYQELLTSEWTKSFPDAVLSLLWSSVSKQASAEKLGPLVHLLDPEGSASFPTELFQSIVARIAEGTKFTRFAELPPLPTEYRPAKRLANVARHANSLATYLTLPAHATISGNTTFFADLSALAFQAAIHSVLPDLQKKHAAEHAVLLHSAALFSVGYCAYDPAHYAYMMSQIHGYLGDEEQRIRSLYASFRFTSPQDHSYLTKAQEFWSELLDQEKYEQAEQFLFSLPWWSLPAQQDEVREMAVDAFRYIVSCNGSRKTTAGAVALNR